MKMTNPSGQHSLTRRANPFETYSNAVDYDYGNKPGLVRRDHHGNGRSAIIKNRPMVIAASALALIQLTLHLKNNEHFDLNIDRKSAQVWKTAAHACSVRPVDLDGSWYKSQDEEDRDLLKWFKDICGGTYLEIGGLDGITISNSYLYNKGLNWTGILVEASPVNYAKLIKNRQNEIATVHAGVCEKEVDLHWVESDQCCSGFQEFAAPSFQQHWWSEEQIRNAKVVQCKTLERILLDTVGERFYFDFFTLDVEGAEYAILQSINFDLVGFGAIVVEADEHNQMKNMAIRTMLESNGYTYLETKRRSSWFVHNDFGIIYKELIYAL